MAAYRTRRASLDERLRAVGAAVASSRPDPRTAAAPADPTAAAARLAAAEAALEGELSGLRFRAEAELSAAERRHLANAPPTTHVGCSRPAAASTEPWRSTPPGCRPRRSVEKGSVTRPGRNRPDGVSRGVSGSGPFRSRLTRSAARPARPPDQRPRWVSGSSGRRRKPNLRGPGAGVCRCLGRDCRAAAIRLEFALSMAGGGPRPTRCVSQAPPPSPRPRTGRGDSVPRRFLGRAAPTRHAGRWVGRFSW